MATPALYASFATFLLPISLQKYLDLAFVAITIALVVALLVRPQRFGRPSTQQTQTLPMRNYLAFGVAFFVAAVTTDYSLFYTASTFAFLISAGYQLAPIPAQGQLNWNGRKVETIFVRVTLMIVTWQLFIAITEETPLILWAAWDGNFTGIALFLLFMYGVKRRYPTAVVVSPICLYANESRLFQVLTLLFLAVFLLRKTLLRPDWMAPRGTAIAVIIISALGTLGISHYWTEVVSGYGVDPYRSGWNDTSNRMRALANMEALELFRNDPLLMVRGYDQDLKNVMGVVDTPPKDSLLPGELRRVVPHNSVLNLILQVGLLGALTCLAFLGTIIDRVFIGRNIEFIIPYIIGSCVMHSLFTSQYVVMWLLLLLLPPWKISTNAADRGPSRIRPRALPSERGEGTRL